MSRLLALYILLAIQLVNSTTLLQAQDYRTLGVSKADYNRIKKEVNKLTEKEQIFEFLILEHGQYSSSPAGYIKNTKLTDSQGGNLDIINLSSVAELNQLPFPNYNLRNGIDYPYWLASAFNADFVADLIPDTSYKMIGLDSIGIYLKATGYEDSANLSETILKHDLVYYPGAATVLNQELTSNKLKSRQKKALKKKLINKKILKPQGYVSPNKFVESHIIRDWLIGVYAKNYSGATYLGNWLAQLIAEESNVDAFNSEGVRIRLVGGADRIIKLNKTKLNSIDSLITLAINERAIPGCQLLVAKDGYIILDKSYGFLTYDSLNPVHSNTLYDLASLTKPLATTQALMFLVEEQAVNLDHKVSSYLPYLNNTNKEGITVKEILAHQADLYPYYPFWKRAQEELALDKMAGPLQIGSELWVEGFVADSILSWAANSDLLSERIDTITHEQYMYSDLGFYFLFDLIERISGEAMDSYLHRNLFRKIDTGLLFNPLANYPKESIAPTEYDKLLRNELIQGFVHDRNAALFGGVAGQAGLFGSAVDVAKLMQLHLDNGVYGGEKIYDPETIAKFRTRPFEGNRRGLGWDMPGNEPDGPVSSQASTQTFGHTGFTGAMVWADPKENLIFVFLSNRVFPTAENEKLIEMNIRTKIQELIYRALPKE